MISTAVVLAGALAFTLFIARVFWRDYQNQQRVERQAKCREWIEWKLRENSSVTHYEAQCAFRMLMDPEWDARGPWEWEQEPRPISVHERSRLARELWPHDKGMWH